MMNTPTEPAIAVTGLRRSYGNQLVLDDIDLHVSEGTVFALLGPNGAGKTTLVQILSTLIRAAAGEARVCGHDVDRGVALPVGVPGGHGVAEVGHGKLVLVAPHAVVFAISHAGGVPPARNAETA